LSGSHAIANDPFAPASSPARAVIRPVLVRRLGVESSAHAERGVGPSGIVSEPEVDRDVTDVAFTTATLSLFEDSTLSDTETVPVT
jgi:hypothetical protein